MSNAADGGVDTPEIATIEAAAKAALVANEQWHTYSEEGPSRCPCGGETYSVCTTRAIDTANDDAHRCIAEVRGDNKANAYAIATHVAAASPAAVLKLIQRLRDTEHERDEMIRQHADTVKDRDENFRSMMRMVAMAAHWYEIAGDAMTAGLAECERLRDALRRMVQYAMLSHPLPWHIEEDWTKEVSAADGFIIVKCMTMAEAATIIREAEEYQAEMDAVIPDVEAWLREQDNEP